MCYFCILHVRKYICIVYAPSSYFEGLRGSAKWKKKKKGLQTASGPVTDMSPSGCSVKWTVLDCTDLGLCVQQAANVSITAGEESRKDRCKNKLLILIEEKGQFGLKLRS